MENWDFFFTYENQGTDWLIIYELYIFQIKNFSATVLHEKWLQSKMWFFQQLCMDMNYMFVWTTNKAECWRIDAFELWCWRRHLRDPWTAKRSNQSIVNNISPEYSLGRLMLKLQYFGHLMWRIDTLEKILMLWKIEGRRRKWWQRMRWLYRIPDSINMSLSKLWEWRMDREA